MVNIAEKHIRREAILEGEQCNGGEIVEHYDGQDDEDQLEGSLLHRVHLVSARPRLLQDQENRNVAVDHEGENSEDDSYEDPVEVNSNSVSYCTLSSRVCQNHQPDHRDQGCSVFAVFDFGEGDGVDHSYISVKADAGQEEWWGVFHAVEEAQNIPGAARVEEEDVGQLQRKDETEEYV